MFYSKNCQIYGLEMVEKQNYQQYVIIKTWYSSIYSIPHLQVP